MHFKATVPAGIFALGIATFAHAAPAIDFVNRDDSATTYSAMRCVATHRDSRAYRAVSHPRENVSTVPLAVLLAGDPGPYTIECTAALGDSHERYTAKFDAVKLKQGEPGNEAPEYDENGFGYGIKIPLSQTRTRCYDAITLRMDQGCLDAYYGNGRYVVVPYASAPEVTFNGHREYSANVGIFLEDNPRHPAGHIQHVEARKATGIASPFQSAR